MASHQVSFEPVEVSRYQHTTWRLRFSNEDPFGQDGFFRVALQVWSALWPLIRPLRLDGVLAHGASSAKHEKWCSFNLHADAWPAGLAAQTKLRERASPGTRQLGDNPGAISVRPLSSQSSFESAMTELLSLVPPADAGAARDLKQLVAQGAAVRMLDDTKAPGVVGAFSDRATHDILRVPLVSIDGEWFLPCPPVEFPVYDPLGVSLFNDEPAVLSITSYWAPWMLPGTKSHQAVEDIIAKLGDLGWTLESKVLHGHPVKTERAQ